MGNTNHRIAAATLAIVFYLIHAGVLLSNKEAYHMIWSCHLGCLLVGVGLLIHHRRLYAIGFFWLTLGVPLWILNVLTRDEFMLTSTLSHIGGLIIAVYGLRFVKIPQFTWAAAAVGLVILGFFSRLVTPQNANVNLAFAVWSGWEKTFPSYFWYVVMLLAIAAICFWVLEFFVRRAQSGGDQSTSANS